MQADEIRELTAADIQTRITELEEERFRLRFRSATEPLEDPLRLRVVRKDIARLKTVLAEMQREKAEKGGKAARAKKGGNAARAKKGRKAGTRS